MEGSIVGFLELFIVFAFAIGLGVFELVSLRMERRKDAEKKAAGETQPNS